MASVTNPRWWRSEYDQEWAQVQPAFQRSWQEQPHLVYAAGPHHRGATMIAPGPNRPPAGSYDLQEPAFRFGFGAQRNYGVAYPQWNDRLANQLHQDWAESGREEWNRNLNAIRRGWEFAAQGAQAAA